MNENDLIRQNLLIEILLDPKAADHEKDDAAMDLEDYDSDEALNALIKAGSNPKEDHGVLDVCGESICKIWLRRNFFDVDLFKKLPNWTQNGIYTTVEAFKPNWVTDYQLDLFLKGVSIKRPKNKRK